MKTLELTKLYAVVEFSKAVLEYYNPSIVFESDSIEECEDYECEEGPTSGCTVLEKREDGIYGYYTGEEFEMKSYN
jgi:hypothetical protein